MLSVFVRRTTICILWLLVLWNSWECRGLLGDGALVLAEAVRKDWFFNFDAKAREYAIGTSQIPLVVGLKLDVKDLHWLARLQSFGAFALPTALYQIALMRAKDDAVLLAAVILAISMVFLTTSFFIVGEYNTAYATAIAAATWVATADRPRLSSGIALVVLAVLALRTYEVFVYLGPLLAFMIVCAIPRDLRPRWFAGRSRFGFLVFTGLLIAVTVLAFLGVFPTPLCVTALLVTVGLVQWRHPRCRPELAGFLYVLAALLFLTSMLVAIDSVARMGGAGTMHRTVFAFWRNMPFDLALGATLVMVFWSVAKPADLGLNRPYLWAGLWLVGLALLPLIPLGDTVRPLDTHYYNTRTICGLVTAGVAVFIWARRAYAGTVLAVFGILQTPEAGRRLLGFSFAMLLAMLPSEIGVTKTWISVLDTIRKVVQTREGTIAFESLPSEIPRYYWLYAEFMPNLSLILRSRLTDSVVAFPGGNTQEVPAALGEYFWRN